MKLREFRSEFVHTGQLSVPFAKLCSSYDFLHAQKDHVA
jgi:hypothetical protein